MHSPSAFCIVLVSILLTSCSFNGAFLVPSKITASSLQLKVFGETDSSLVLFSGENHQPTFTTFQKDTIDMGFTIESVIFNSTSGNKLNAWILKPKDHKADITLLHFHGNAGNLFSQYAAVAPLLKFGFQIFMFDYSGFGFSEGEATKQNVLKDALSALDFLKTRPDLNSTKLVIYGQSLGGHLSAVVAAKRQNDIDGLVIEGAFSSHKDMVAKFAGRFGRLVVNEKYSATRSIVKYRKPLLLIHSSEDDVIPIEMGRKIFAKANQPKEFYEITKCHICGPRYFADSIAVKIRRMLEVKTSPVRSSSKLAFDFVSIYFIYLEMFSNSCLYFAF